MNAASMVASSSGICSQDGRDGALEVGEGRYVAVDAPPVEAHAVGSQRQLELGAEPADDVLVRVDPLTTTLDDDAVGKRRRPGPAADPVARLEHDHLVAGPVQPSTRRSVPPGPHPPRRSAWN